ncbi:MAG: DUF115 domain-containing protein [Treponema sp.]|nr:DUF115 domain-containing protein [Treponema sp.]
MRNEELSYWEKNSKILQEQFPGLREKILEDQDTIENLKIETAASGVPTLSINGIYVHSPRDPEREGRRLAEACLAEASANAPAQPVVVLGFGLGYAAQALAEMAPERPIIIVEKNLNLLRTAFELRDFSRLLSRTGIVFTPGGSGEGVITALALFEKSAPCILRNRTLTGADEQWYASVESRIRTWAMRDEINTATHKKFGRRWVNNLSRNMSAIRDLPGISRLGGLASLGEAPSQSEGALPVFLAAAGPGLDSIGPLLPEIHKRCIIVAVDTSLRFLHRNGIAPDFALVVDPQFLNSRHLNRCVSPHTRLIAETAVYPPVLRFPFREMYLCSSLYPLGAFIEQRVDPKGHLGAGGSVATTAWDFSRILGAQEIWIAGLDLAFPGLRTHFRGAQFEEKALAESGHLYPAETWLVHALRDGNPFYAPALSDPSAARVLTDRRLSLYATWFESRFRQFPAIRNYSLSPGGLAIEGLEPAETQALLALPERRAEIDQRLQAASSRITAEFFEQTATRQRSDRYQNAVAALVSGLEQIKETCKKGIAIAERALSPKTTPAEQETTLAELDTINRSITGSEVKEIASFLFPAGTVAAPPKDKNTTFHHYVTSSIQLYQSLVEAQEFTRKFMY